MKRSALPLFFALAVPLLAAAAYALLFFTQRAEEPPTAVCTAAVWQETLPLSGKIVREEVSVAVPEGTVYLLAAPGERVGAGRPLALVCETGEEYFRAALLLRVRAERSADEVPAPDETVLCELSAALTRRDFAALSARMAEASRSLGLSGADEETLCREESDLIFAGAESAVIVSPCAGLFAVSADGAMRIAGNGWKFAAPLTPEGTARLAGGLEGLSLPDGTLTAAALAVADGGDGAFTAVFSCDTHAASVLSLEECTLTVRLGAQEGLVVPEPALEKDETGGYYVCRTAGTLREYVSVSVLARRDGLALVTAEGLRDGSRVLLFPEETGG